MAFEIELG